MGKCSHGDSEHGVTYFCKTFVLYTHLTEYIELLILYENPPNGIYWLVNIYETHLTEYIGLLIFMETHLTE